MYFKIDLEPGQEDSFIKFVNTLYEDIKVISVNYIRNNTGDSKVIYLIDINTKILGDYSFILGKFIKAYLKGETFKFKIDTSKDTLISFAAENIVFVNNEKTFEFCKKVILLFTYFLSKNVYFVSDNFFEIILDCNLNKYLNNGMGTGEDFKKLINNKNLDIEKSFISDSDIEFFMNDKSLIILIDNQLFVLNNNHIEDNLDYIIPNKNEKFKMFKKDIIKKI